MKITRANPEFKPIQITLESAEEVGFMIHALLRMGIEQPTDEERSWRIRLYQDLSDVDKMV